MHKSKIAIVANYFALCCMLLTNSWLIINHGHDAKESLLQNDHLAKNRVVVESIHCHDTRADLPLFESHTLWQYPFSQCLICLFYQGNYTVSQNGNTCITDLPEIFHPDIPEAGCHAVPAFSFQLRAPPYQARYCQQG